MECKGSTLCTCPKQQQVIRAHSHHVCNAGTKGADNSANVPAGGSTRTYYISADLIQWDYTPMGFDACSGEPFTEDQSVGLALQPQHKQHPLLQAPFVTSFYSCVDFVL